MTSKLTITDERIEKIAVWLATESHSLNLEMLTCLRELQERRKADSEPVATLDVQSGRPDGNKFALAYSSAAHKLPDDVYFLYRHAQPAPVVPDAATAIRACLSEFPESVRDIVEECADIAENACRAAMLQENEKSAGASNNCRSRENVQDLQAGNSPVIPDTWIPVSKQLPDPKSEQRVCVYTPTPHEDIRYRFVPASLFKAVCSDATHWHYMEPPVGPQGVKGE